MEIWTKKSYVTFQPLYIYFFLSDKEEETTEKLNY